MVRPIVVWDEGGEILSRQGGLGIIGVLVDQLPLGQRLNQTHIPENLHPDIAHRDVVVAYMGLLAQGKSDFDHMEAYRNQFGVSTECIRCSMSNDSQSHQKLLTTGIKSPCARTRASNVEARPHRMENVRRDLCHSDRTV